MDMFRRKSTKVEARLVTADNLESVAAWCRGSIKGVKLERYKQTIEIYTEAYGELRADVGDWMVKEGDAFCVYQDMAFNSLFEKI